MGTLFGIKRCILSNRNTFLSARPEPVHNCTQLELSHESIMLKCSPGFDGGLAQLFTLELRPWTLSANPLDNKGMMMRSNSVAANVEVDPDSDPTRVNITVVVFIKDFILLIVLLPNYEGD